MVGLETSHITVERSFDPQVYLRALLRRRWLILGIAVAVFLAVAGHTLRQHKIYAASTSVIIDSVAPKFLDSSQVQDVTESGGGTYWFQKEYYETQYKVILSRSVATRVVDKLGLQSDWGFLGLTGIKDPAKRQELAKAIDAVDLVRGRIQVTPVKDSRVVLISVEDEDPKRAALLSNEVANAYIAENLALKLNITESASKWLEDRLASLESQSKASELATYEFKKNADMLTTSLEDHQSMLSQRLGALNGALTDVKTKLAGLKARVSALDEVRRTQSREGLVHWAEGLDLGEKSLVMQLKVRYALQRDECAELRDRYLDGHPKLVACNEKLNSIQKTLARELENVVQASQVELKEALLKERNLTALLDEAKAEAFEVNKKQIEFERLKREADNNQRLYDVVLKRLKDIELSGLLRTSNVRVLDWARPSFVPLRPNVPNAMVLGVILGILLGVGAAVGLEKLDNTFKNQHEIEERLGLPFLGIVPRLEEKETEESGSKDLYVFRKPKTAVAESCRAIRTNLLFMTPDKPLKTLLVTSSSPREGKSTSVINLGIAMAQSGSRVLILDTDMRRPRLHQAFGVSNDQGISSVVVGEAKVEEVVKSTEVPGLWVMPCGPIPPNPAELLHTEAFRQVLQEVSSQYDRVILDSAPVNAVADALVLATQVDGVLLVVNAGRTPRALAQRSARSLLDVKATIFGVILNEVDLKGSAYGGYYSPYAGYGTEYAEKQKDAA